MLRNSEGLHALTMKACRQSDTAATPSVPGRQLRKPGPRLPTARKSARDGDVLGQAALTAQDQMSLASELTVDPLGHALMVDSDSGLILHRRFLVEAALLSC